eukprot:UN09645
MMSYVIAVSHLFGVECCSAAVSLSLPWPFPLVHEPSVAQRR